MSQSFKRTIEDFTCEQCDFHVQGNGYTNHCPQCLWSKHVDVHPGDRAASCVGMMSPAAVLHLGGECTIVHVCVLCGLTKKNKAGDDDNLEELSRLSAEPL